VRAFPGWRIREAKAALSGWNALLLQMSRASDSRSRGSVEYVQMRPDRGISEASASIAERHAIAGQRRRHPFSSAGIAGPDKEAPHD